MRPTELLNILHTAEKLKDTTRHCDTSGGRRESVAEHSWRIALMAFFLRDEFPRLDMDKVLQMCLIHDLGECFTGDIPSFLKTDADTTREDSLLAQWVSSLPAPYCTEMAALYAEMDALETDEARLYKALDKLEAVIQHNEAPISTWLPREYALNLTLMAKKYARQLFLIVSFHLQSVIRDRMQDLQQSLQAGRLIFAQKVVSLVRTRKILPIKKKSTSVTV